MAAVTIGSDFGAPKMKSVTVSIVSPSICHEVMEPDAMILVFWMLSFKPTFSLSSFTFIKRLFSSLLSAIRLVSSLMSHTVAQKLKKKKKKKKITQEGEKKQKYLSVVLILMTTTYCMCEKHCSNTRCYLSPFLHLLKKQW